MTPTQTAALRGDAEPGVIAGLTLQSAPDDDLLATILQSLDDDQAHDVTVIPLAGKTSIADYMVIASGRSTRQVASMAEHLRDKLKAERGLTAKVEGLPHADWVLIDAVDVIVHLFRPEVRTFYNLEKMWSIDVTPASRLG